MKKLLGRLGLVVTLATVMGLVAGQSTVYGASAGVSSAVVVGSGTISPGLSNPTVGVPPGGGSPQAVTFSGNAVAEGIAVNGDKVGAAAGLFSCSFTGGTSAGGKETTVSGTGTATGNCTGGTIGSGTISCTVNYTRVGAVVVLQITCTAHATLLSVLGTNVSANGSGVGVCLFAPDQATPPVTSYKLVCGAAGAGASL